MTDSPRPTDPSAPTADLSVATSTDAVHAGEPTERPDRALTLPIVQTATYRFRDTAELVSFFEGRTGGEEYGRYGNPTTREVELRLAELDAAEDAILFASGMGAITTTMLALLKAGDHVILFKDVYRRTRQFVAQFLGRLGIEHTLVPPTDLDAFEAAIRKETKLAVTESPTNPYLRCVDLKRFAAIGRARGIKTVVDSTFATPINCRPLAFGVDLVTHSATKYLAGHNDVLGGTLSGKRGLVSLVRDARSVLGGVIDPHAASLVGRGMKTLALRVRQQNASALAVARFLSERPGVARVHYPGLDSHPDYAIASRQMSGFGGVVSFEMKDGRDAARRVVDACRLAAIAPSLGGVETLIEQPCVMSFFGMSDEELAEVGIHPGLIRLAVGIERTDDILDDLAQALEQAGAG